MDLKEEGEELIFSDPYLDYCNKHRDNNDNNNNQHTNQNNKKSNNITNKKNVSFNTNENHNSPSRILYNSNSSSNSPNGVDMSRYERLYNLAEIQVFNMLYCYIYII